jgi:hypothetical protein
VTQASPTPDGLVALLVNRGDVQLYRPDETNRCPRCSHSNWLIGRITAECAFCSTALPLVHPSSLDPERNPE